MRCDNLRIGSINSTFVGVFMVHNPFSVSTKKNHVHVRFVIMIKKRDIMKIIEFLKKGYDNLLMVLTTYPISVIIGLFILLKILGWLGFQIPMVWSSGEWIYF